ncbi:hypothetical protein MNBD_GAMMA21-1457 [hydrothermal vent metagenome]|uniref:Type IV pilus biogenesis protein PilE n=1 Tax=hydrothermal vent metagenome TaxID=652676 RepID=A0A3B1AAU2_9ZZZZ
MRTIIHTTFNSKGFSLIELMVTISILAIVAGIALPAYSGYMKSAYLSECAKEVGIIKLAQQEFFLENNAYFPNPANTSTGVVAIETDSLNIYTSSYTVQGNPVATASNIATANCTYSVTSTAAPSFTVTATGQNQLAATDTFTQTN